MPTRLTCVTPPPAMGAERASAHTTPYCSPGAASAGAAIVTMPVSFPPAGTSGSPGTTDVHVESSLAACPVAPRKELFSMLAAEAYSWTRAVEAVVFGNLDAPGDPPQRGWLGPAPG